MQASNTSPARTAARPAVPLATVRRNPQWPFPVGTGNRQNAGVLGAAPGVISTSARAYLAQQSPSEFRPSESGT